MMLLKNIEKLPLQWTGFSSVVIGPKHEVAILKVDRNRENK